jgi:hypothetical protein
MSPPRRENGTASSASVRECLETWWLQHEAGPVTVEALEAIVARAAVPIVRQIDQHPPDVAMELFPSLIRIMLAAFLEVMAADEDDAP